MAFNHIVFNSDYDESIPTESGRIFVWKTHSKVNKHITFCTELNCSKESHEVCRSYSNSPSKYVRTVDDIREDIVLIQEKLSWPMTQGQTADWLRLLNRRMAALTARGASMWEGY